MMARVEINAGGRVVIVDDSSEAIEILAARAFVLWTDTETDETSGAPFGFVSDRRPQSSYDATYPVHAEKE